VRRSVIFPAILLATALALRAAAPDNLTLPRSVPTPDDLPTLLLRYLPNPAAIIRPTGQLDVEFFLPRHLLPSVANIPPPETRTVAQLEALLNEYVGTWRGESTWYSTASGKILHYPTELIYRFEDLPGGRVLTCIITYHINGAPTTSLAHLWVERGHIVSETAQGGKRQHFIAHTAGANLIWSVTDTTEALFDFGETETLRLTANGGHLTTTGYEIQHSAQGPVLVHESSDLELAK